MAEARSRAAWGHTSSAMALLANCHRDPKKGRPLRPDDFDPYARRGRGKGGRRPVTVDRLADEIMRLAGEKAKGR
jgi:hypothetical protein